MRPKAAFAVSICCSCEEIFSLIYRIKALVGSLQHSEHTDRLKFRAFCKNEGQNVRSGNSNNLDSAKADHSEPKQTTIDRFKLSLST